APARDGEHRRRDVGTDHPESPALEECGQDAGPARGVAHEAPVRNARECPRARALGRPKVQPPAEAAVAAALVALGVEVAIAPARVVVLGDRLHHARATPTTTPESDQARR